VKDKDIEGALQLRNLSVTRGLLAQSQLWQRLDDIIAALDKEEESEDAKTRVKAKNLSNVSNSSWS
jgi:ABC-type transport system involved in cytochrome c biogenesis ATPase subunit